MVNSFLEKSLSLLILTIFATSLFAGDAFAQIEVGVGSWKVKTIEDKFRTRTKIEYFRNFTGSALELKFSTLFAKRKYTTGNLIYNRVLAAWKAPLLPNYYQFTNIDYKKRKRAFNGRGYVYVVAQNVKTGAIVAFWRWDSKKYRFTKPEES